MASIVKERLDKWDKTSREQAKVDTDCFCLWLEKSKEDIVAEFYTIEKAVMIQRWKRDYGDYLYQWYKDLMKGTEVFVKVRGRDKYRKEKRSYAHNTARRMAYTVAAFLRKTCTSVIFETKIPKAVPTTQPEHEFTYEELKRMFTVGDVEERAIVQLGVNLGLRVEDFSTLLREPFERAIQLVKSGKAETPYELKLETGKEKIIAYAQLTEKTIDVLSTYLQTKETTKYLFSENHRKRHITPRQLNYCLKRLWEKAYPENKGEANNIHWHLLRKYLITTLQNNDLAETSIRMITGKATATDYKTYLQRVNLSEEFGKAINQVALGSFIRLKNHETELREKIGKLEEAILSQEKQMVHLQTRLQTVTKTSIDKMANFEKQLAEVREILPIVHDRLLKDFEKARIKRDVTIPRLIEGYRKLVEGLEEKRDKTEKEEELIEMLTDTQATLEYWNSVLGKQEDLASELENELARLQKITLAITKRKKKEK